MCLVLRKGNCFIDLQRHLRFNKYLSLAVCLLTPIERTVSWQTSESFSTSFKGYCELHMRKKQLEIHLSGRLLKTNSQEISFIYEAIKSVFPLLWIWQSFLLCLDSTGAPFFFSMNYWNYLKHLSSVHLLLFFFFSQLQKSIDQKDFFRHCSCLKNRSQVIKKKIPSLVAQEVIHTECKHRHGKFTGKSRPTGPQCFCKGHMQLNPWVKNWVDSLPSIAHKCTYLQCVVKDLQ